MCVHLASPTVLYACASHASREPAAGLRVQADGARCGRVVHVMIAKLSSGIS